METEPSLHAGKHKRKSQGNNNETHTKKKRKSGIGMSTEERERLEKAVLGDGSNLFKSMDDDSGVEDEGSQSSDERQPAWRDDDDFDESGAITTGEAMKMQGARNTPLAVDLDEDYQELLRRKFESIIGTPNWAKLDKSKSTPPEDPDEVDLLRSCGNMIQKKVSYLPKTVLDVKRLASLNSQTRNEGNIIKCIEFHKKSTVALVAGLSGVISIYQVDGRGNNKLASVQFEKFPIRCARFTEDGNQFIVGSQHHSHFYCYDMMEGRSIKIPIHHNIKQTNMKRFEISPDGTLIAVCGKFGNIHLLTANSKEWIGGFQMNGEVHALAFNPDGSILYSFGDSGEVYMWDMKGRTCLGRFYDEGCLQGTALAVSSQIVATGSSSGIVNLYDASQLQSQRNPAPLKLLKNLVTSISHLRFNNSGQILAMASDEKDNSVRLVHFPSMTVFSNFPSLNSDLHRVQTVAFSPNSGYMGIGNNKTTASLFRLRHFGNY